MSNDIARHLSMAWSILETQNILTIQRWFPQMKPITVNSLNILNYSTLSNFTFTFIKTLCEVEKILIIWVDIAVFSSYESFVEFGLFLLLNCVAGLEFVIISFWIEVFCYFLWSFNNGCFSILWVDSGEGSREANDGEQGNSDEL